MFLKFFSISRTFGLFGPGLIEFCLFLERQVGEDQEGGAGVSRDPIGATEELPDDPCDANTD